jgi:RsmE family RNA methyltransferase
MFMLVSALVHCSLFCYTASFMNCLLLPQSAFISPANLASARQPTEQNCATEHFAAARINDAQQIAHIHTVLAAKVGDTLKIGRQDGNLGTGIIQRMDTQEIELAEVNLTEPPPAKLELTVVLALPRPKVLRRLIMDMTALGVQHIILINSYRTQKSYWQSPMLARLDEFVQEGLQQACDTVAPRITLSKRFKPFVEDELAAVLAGAIGVVAHPYAPTSLQSFIQSRAADDSVQNPWPKLLCIGAEGGWIDYEIELLQAHGCQAVSIGPRILRTEAAVNALIGQWLIH